MTLLRIAPLLSVWLAFATGFSAHAAVPKVVTTIPPIHSLASMVMEGVGTPDLLLTGWQDPHHFSLKPSQRAELEQAGTVFYVGDNFEHFIADIKAPDSLVFVPLTASGGSGHPWMSINEAAAMVDRMAERLQQSDPEHAPSYRVNAVKAKASLKVLDAKLSPLFKRESDKTIAVVHAAFDGFERQFQLPPTMALTRNHTGSLTLAAFKGLEGREVSCLFVMNKPTDADRTIAKRLGAQIKVVNVQGGDLPIGKTLYPMLIEQVAQQYRACLT